MDQTGEAAVHSPINIHLPGQTQPFTIDPADLSSQSGRSGIRLLQTQKRMSKTGHSGRRLSVQSGQSDTRSGYSGNFKGIDTDSDGSNGMKRLTVPQAFVLSGADGNENRLRIPANFMSSGTESDNEAEISKRRNAQLLVSKFAKMGGKLLPVAQCVP